MRPLKTALAALAILLVPIGIFSQVGIAELASSPAAFHFNRGVQHHDASEFTQAGTAYREALACNPNLEDAWYNLAIVQIQMGNYAQAERSLDTLFSIDAFDASSHALHGLVLYHQGHFERAVAAYNFALQNKVNNNLLLARGLAYYGSGQMHLASRDFDAVLAADPGNARACQAKAAVLLEKENYHLAIRFCNRILDRKPSDVGALVTRAVCRFQQGAVFRAMADFDLALTNGHLPAIYLARADCRLQANDLAGARNDTKYAMRLDPMEPAVYSLLGEIELAEERPEDAMVSFNIAVELTPNNANNHLQCCRAAMQAGDFQLAVEEIYTALELGLPDEVGKAFLRQIYQQNDLSRYSMKSGLD